MSIRCSLFLPSVHAEPIYFSEVSLLVRARESEPSIIHEVSQRKLVRALTPEQEKTLKTQGAGESLLRALRRSDITLAAADATAFEAREQKRSVPPVSVRATSSMDAGQDGLQIFEVSIGHPINLSQWGGPDYEFASILLPVSTKAAKMLF